jgi:uncharacterized protein YigE (DUF2233 family)
MKKMNFRRFCQILSFLILIVFCCCNQLANKPENEQFITFTVPVKESNLEFFWKDESGNIFGSIGNLKKNIEAKGQKLRFAMNGGMYQENNKPLGLFIQQQKTITPLNTRENAAGNFYIQPNGVFCIATDKKAFVVSTQEFKDDGQIEFATQSGPMLLIDGQINPNFTENSDNLNIRNGVCVLDNTEIVFAISRQKVNFYNFAQHFKNLGCRNALYLDGFVSRMYLPEKNVADLDGDFGVIIGITE